MNFELAYVRCMSFAVQGFRDASASLSQAPTTIYIHC